LSGPLVEKLANFRRGNAPDRAPALADLTNRERDVLALIGEGLSDKAIAARLRVSPSTVRNHATAIYSKLDVHTRAEAMLWARERGFSGKAAGVGRSKGSRHR
jgi:DNA-binding NarL/FixJ family response regulator